MIRTIYILLFMLLAGNLSAQHISDFISVSPGAQSEEVVLPSTHSFQVIIQTGDSLDDGTLMPSYIDYTGFMQIGSDPDSGFLCINSETSPGAVVILKLYRNPISGLWERVNGGRVNNLHLIAGTKKNCSGQVTEWNTFISCEENADQVDTNMDGRYDFGWCFEIDPVTRKVLDYDNDGTPDKLWQMGRMFHENIAIAADRKTVYFGEDSRFSGFVYKYVCDSAEQLQSGDLYVLQKTGAHTGKWIPLGNKSIGPQNHMPAIANNAGASHFEGVEDVEIGQDSFIYFTSKFQGALYRFKDRDSIVVDLDTVAGAGASYLITDASGSTPTSVPFATGADNLAIDTLGNIWLQQDEIHTTDSNYVWVIGKNHTDSMPDIRLFSKIPKGAEPSGISFTPSDKFMFMSVMHPLDSNSTSQVDIAGSLNTFDRDAAIIVARTREWLPEISTKILPSDSAICQGDSAFLSVPFHDNLSYQWEKDGILLHGDTTNALTVFGAGNFRCKISTFAGDTFSSLVSVRVISYPDDSIFLQGPNIFCSYKQTYLKAISNPNWSYRWQKNGIDIPGKDAFDLQTSLDGAIRVIIGNEKCFDTSRVINLFHYPQPNAHIAPLSGPKVCLNDTVIMEAQPAGHIYRWFENGNKLNFSSQQISSTVAGNYVLVVENSDGCIDTSSTLQTVIYSLPNASLTEGPEVRRCGRDSAILGANTSGYQYQWIKNGANISGATMQSYSMNTPGDYAVFVTDSNNCSMLSDEVRFIQDSIPQSSIVSPKTEACQGDAITIRATKKNNVLYSWYKNNQLHTLPDSFARTVFTNTKFKLVQINATNQNCRDTSSEVQLIIHSNPTVTLSLSGTQRACDTQGLNLRALQSNLKYQWLESSTQLNGDTSQAKYLTQSGFYSVIVTDSNNCSSRSSTLNFIQDSIPTSTILSSKTEACDKDSIVIRAASKPNVNYTWLKNGLPSSGNNQLIRVTYSSSTFQLIETNQTNANCRDTSSLSLTIHPNPDASLNLSGTIRRCDTQGVNLKALNSGQKYQWQRGPSTLQFDTLQNLYVTRPGNYIVLVTDSNSCRSLSPVINFVQDSIPESFIQFNRTEACDRDSIILSTVSKPNVGYTWLRRGQIHQDPNQLRRAIYSTDTFALIQTNLTNQVCKDTSNTLAITIHPNPDASLNLGGTIRKCDTQGLNLNALVSGLKYQWQRGVHTLGKDTFQSIYIDTTGLYYLLVTDSNNCKTLSAAVNFIQDSIPDGSIHYVRTQACEGEEIGLKTVPSQNNLVRWFRNGVRLNGVTTDYKARQSGLYKLFKSNMANSACADSSVVLIDIHPLPVARLNKTGVHRICKGEPLQFEVMRSNLSYQWMKDGSTLSGETNRRILPNSSGNYYVQITDSNNCTAYTDTVQLIIDSIPQSIVQFDSLSTCFGKTLGLKSAVKTNVSYQWLKNQSIISGATSSDYTVNQSGVYQLIQSNTSNSRCIDTSQAVNMVIHPLPNRNLNRVGIQSTCQQDSLVLKSYGRAIDFHWFKDGLTFKRGTIDSIWLSVPGDYHLRLVDSNNCVSYSDTIKYTQDALPNAQINSSRIEACDQDSILLQAPGQAGVEYFWFRNGAPLGFLDSVNVHVKTTGTYMLIMRNGAHPACADTTTKSISFNALPDPAINRSGSFQICEGDSFAVSAINSGLTYRWIKNGSSHGTNQQSIWLKSSGSFSLEAKNAKQCVAISDSFRLQVDSIPVSNISSSRTSACFGDSIILQAIGKPNVRYDWFYNGMAQIVSDSTELRSRRSGMYQLVQSNLSNLSCSDTSELAITFNALPILKIDTIGSAEFCMGDSAVLKVRKTGQNLQYEWYKGGLKLPNSTDSLVISQASIYSILILDSNQCSSVDSVEIRTNPLPNADILTPSQNIFCDNDSIELKAVNQNYVRYQWLRNSMPLLRSDASSITVKLAGAYSLEVVDSNYCSSISTFIQLQTKESPNISLDPFGKSSKCEGDSIDYVILGSKPSHAYTWMRNNDTLKNFINQGSINVKIGGSYRVLTVDSNGCSSTSLVSEFEILANPSKPMLEITPSGLSSSSANQYQWFLNAVPISNESQQKILTRTPGYYQVKIWNADNCFSISDSLYFVPINEKNLGEKLSTSVYPNPSEGYYNLYIHSTEDGLASAEVFNNLSQEIMAFQMNLNSGVNQYAIDLRNLTNGTYNLRVTFGEEVHVFKLILAK